MKTPAWFLAATLTFAAFSFSPSAAAQPVRGARRPIPKPTPAPVPMTYQDAQDHRLARHIPLHSLAAEPNTADAVELRMVVNAKGKVASAEAVAGPKEYFAIAMAEAKTWRYLPFVQNGHAVSAAIWQYLPIVPAERLPDTHIPFPAVHGWNDLVITLERTGCFDDCPGYSLEIHGNGDVFYHGGSRVAVPGNHHARISPVAVRQMVSAFRRADYFSLDERYQSNISNRSAYITSISFDGRSKSIFDYAGEYAGRPESLAELEDAIDRWSGSIRWVKGNAETIPSLRRENWRFRPRNSQNRNLLHAMVEYGDRKVALALLATGMRVQDHAGTQALQAAAERADIEIVRTLLRKGAGRNDTADLDAALWVAAAKGRLDIVDLLLARGADPQYRNAGKSVLMQAARSGSPAMVAKILPLAPNVNQTDYAGVTALMYVVQPNPWLYYGDVNEAEGDGRAEAVRLLVKAGAQVNGTAFSGETALFFAGDFAGTVQALIAAGADINARNARGETPLMWCGSAAGASALIQAGADVAARDLEGRSALDHAQQRHLDEIAAVLEAANAHKSEQSGNSGL